MKTNDENRMLKKEERMTRDAAALPASPPEAANIDGAFAGFPCIYCQSKTRVAQTFPLQESTQHPARWLRSRRHQCKDCGRSFHTTETLDSEYRTISPPWLRDAK